MENERIPILLVEDNPADAHLLRELLSEAGRLDGDVVHVERLSEAREQLSRGGIGVVLLDLSLPDARGLDVVRRIDAAAPEVPIIALTDQQDDTTPIEALQAGAQDFLVKGEVDGPALVRSIRYARERKRLLEQLESEHERLKTVIRHLPVGVLLAEAPSGRILMSNPQVKQILDYPLPTFHGVEALAELTAYRSDGSRLPSEEWPLVRTLRGATVRGEEFLYEHADGTRSWIRVSGAPTHSAEGEITGSAIIVENIDEEKRAEQAERFLSEAGTLLASSLELEETLERIARLAVRSLADHCIIDLMQPDGEVRRLQVAHADPAEGELGEQLLEYPVDRSRPHLSLSVLETRQPALVPQVTEEFLASLAQDEEHMRILEGFGAVAYIAVPLLARDRLLGAIGCISSQRRYGPEDRRRAEDLARRAALAVDAARLYGEAQEALQARDEVLRIVSHDLRNPLSAIVMSAELLLDSETPFAPEQQARQAQIIRRSAERMNRLIQDLLDVARLEAGRLYLVREYQQPLHLVRESVELNAALAAANSLALRTDGAEATPPVLADRDRILQVLSNLIGNAIKFTPRGGHITVQAEPAEDQVRFSVIDTGPGIPPEHLSQLFRPFWQARRGGRGGAGLGLTIARGIVEAHGGRIWIESEVGKGTTACFALPVAEERRGESPP